MRDHKRAMLFNLKLLNLEVLNKCVRERIHKNIKCIKYMIKEVGR